MKHKATLHTAFLLFATVATAINSASANTTTWTNSGLWHLAGSWSDGVPTGSSDAIMQKISGNDESLIIPTGNAYKTLTVSGGTADGKYLRLHLSNGAIGGNTSFSTSASGRAQLSIYQGASATINGSLSFASSSNVSDSTTLALNGGSTLTVTEGISFGANANPLTGVAALNSYLTHGDLTSNGSTSGVYTGVTINADLTFNNGSRYWVSNDGGANGVLTINGNVTLQAGSFTGGAAEFSVGRASALDNGVMIKIRDHLSVSDSTSVIIRRGKTVEANTATFSTNGRLSLTGWAAATGDSTFRTHGDLTINGGVIQNTAAGTSGSYIIDVGGDFILGTGSTINLSSSVANGLTTLKLEGDFKVSASSLASSTNLQQLRVVLDGNAPQTLEAAVLGSNQTFRIHTLTFDTDATEIHLVDNYLNVGANEFFRTDNLVNLGTTTLYLNGLDFYVGNTLLGAGTYTTYGGTLTIAESIPEPSTYLLLGTTLAGLIALRRRSKLS